MASVRLRAQDNGNGYSLSLLFDHPMESGRRSDAQGVFIPPWFITHVEVLLDEKPFAHFDLSSLVTKNPILALELDSDAHDKKVRVKWQDNHGDHGERTLKLADL